MEPATAESSRGLDQDGNTSCGLGQLDTPNADDVSLVPPTRPWSTASWSDEEAAPDAAADSHNDGNLKSVEHDSGNVHKADADASKS
jgi:hypothetical protein